MAVHNRLRSLEALLRELHSESGHLAIRNHRALVESLGQGQELILLIRSILSSPGLLAEVASRSYPHVNRFDKIVLVGGSEPPAYRLTLHLWHPPYSANVLREEMIHDHRFNFWSVIVAGTLSSEVFQKRDAGDDQAVALKTYRQYKYLPESLRNHNFEEFYEFQGSVKLLSAGIRRDAAGTSYYLEAPTIHRIILPQQTITCSLVLRGPRLREYSCVYNTTYPSRTTVIANRMFSAPALEHRLLKLVSALEVAAD
jgi:hypothetical protein